MSTINLPTYEQVEEVRQTVLDVEKTSGVLVDVNDSRYRAILEATYTGMEIDLSKDMLNLIGSGYKHWDLGEYFLTISANGSELQLYSKPDLKTVCKITPSVNRPGMNIESLNYISNNIPPIIIFQDHIIFSCRYQSSSTNRVLMVYDINGVFKKAIVLEGTISQYQQQYIIMDAYNGYLYLSMVGFQQHICRFPLSQLIDSTTSTFDARRHVSVIDLINADNVIYNMSDFYIDKSENIMYVITHGGSPTMGVRKYNLLNHSLISKVNVPIPNLNGLSSGLFINKYSEDKLIVFCGPYFITLMDKQTLTVDIYKPYNQSTGYDAYTIFPWVDSSTPLLSEPPNLKSLKNITIDEYILIDGFIRLKKRYGTELLTGELPAIETRILSIDGDIYKYQGIYGLLKIDKVFKILGYKEEV